MICSEFIQELKHTFISNASELSNAARKLPCMEYQKRFLEAVNIAGNPTRKELAAAIGISVQAVGQLMTGKTKKLKTEESARAAAFLEVDHYWLAIGEGRPRPDRAWPYKSFLPSQYRRLDSGIKSEVEQRLLGAIVMMEREPGNGTDG